ncbi:MAG: GvpL/GvpF family gas vesicle protein [Deltaproteobacteria bacterium]|nr:GvpL/GvpF family gas vesicle protein [Deltaproteobacteria bacterium]
MAYLLYGIMKDPVVNGGPMTGVKSKEIFFVTGHGLCVAASEMSAGDGTPPVPELLIYSKVVEDFHRLQAIVPMRYGCFLYGIPGIREALKERQCQYHALLEKLEGQVEMGIRLLQFDLETPPPAVPPLDGRNYLTRQRVHYQMMDEISQHHRMLLDRTIQAFSGLYGKYRVETALKNGSVILSLYFLVPGNKISLFRETFWRVVEDGDTKALISGPWPPYNFVADDLAPPGKYGA